MMVAKVEGSRCFEPGPMAEPSVPPPRKEHVEEEISSGNGNSSTQTYSRVGQELRVQMGPWPTLF